MRRTSLPRHLAAGAGILLLLAMSGAAQDAVPIYSQVKEFKLSGGKSEVNNLVVVRDRVELTLTGSFYFGGEVNGRMTGAVFIGEGNFRAAVPPSEFEKSNLKRLLGVEGELVSDFKTAVFRFTDDSMNVFGKGVHDSAAPQTAQALASDLNPRLLKETAANLASRVALSLINKEDEGIFFANFDGGKRGRFSYLLDPKQRVITDYFDINGGERGIIFKYDGTSKDNDVWMAFYSLADYKSGIAHYSDLSNLIDISSCDLSLDLSDPTKKLGLTAKLKFQPVNVSVTAIPFLIGENLGETDEERLKKQMRVVSAEMNGKPVQFVQEDWEGGFLLVLPSTLTPGQPAEVSLQLAGDFLYQPEVQGKRITSYPISNSTWYPRHGFLDRSTFEMSFIHPKKWKIAAVGMRTSEVPTSESEDLMVTRYSMTQPVALVTFAMGPFVRHADTVNWEKGGTPIPLEFNSLDYIPINEPLIMAEMSNSLRYFHLLFGSYPYGAFTATYHPFNFGQGFPSMLVLPATNDDTRGTFSFISHETAHQWWGNVVAWRSYRDQWLSEGFAEYSGVVYTTLRKNAGESKKLIDYMRASLREPPLDRGGEGKGKLATVGPLILGHRLATKKTQDAYSVLIYNKGALVLRMLHFLFTDPSTGDGKPFFDMMADFVERNRNKTASTEDFREVANEHFARSAIAKRHGIVNLNWFFKQWVYRSELPSYRLEYHIENGPDGSPYLTGQILQDEAPEWNMVLPVYLKFSGNKEAVTTIVARGPSTPVKIKLPMKPEKVELDPNRWILSDKTSTDGK